MRYKCLDCLEPWTPRVEDYKDWKRRKCPKCGSRATIEEASWNEGKERIKRAIRSNPLYPLPPLPPLPTRRGPIKDIQNDFKNAFISLNGVISIGNLLIEARPKYPGEVIRRIYEEARTELERER